MPSYNTSGSGGRSTGVNYATAALFDRIYGSVRTAPHVRRGAQVLAVTYQAVTGVSGGSLKRVARGQNIYQ